MLAQNIREQHSTMEENNTLLKIAGEELMLHHDIGPLKNEFLSNVNFKSEACRKAVENESPGFIRKHLQSSYSEYLYRFYETGIWKRKPLKYEEFVDNLAKTDREALRKIVVQGIREAQICVSTINSSLSCRQPDSKNTDQKNDKFTINLVKFLVGLSASLTATLATLNSDEIKQLIVYIIQIL